MSTIHNRAEVGDIAEKILLPGDPLRAKYLAENFLEDYFLFNDIRNMFGYTGYYKGQKVSVMGTGMGMASIGIYAHELIHGYGVKELVRIGSCGTYQPDVALGDIIFAQGACTDSNFAYQYELEGTFSAISSYELLSKGVELAREKSLQYLVGNIITSDIFYNQIEDDWKKWEQMGILAVDMETYALYCLAARAGVKALTLLTVSDSFHTGEAMTAEERERSLRHMIEIGLGI